MFDVEPCSQNEGGASARRWRIGYYALTAVLLVLVVLAVVWVGVYLLWRP